MNEGGHREASRKAPPEAQGGGIEMGENLKYLFEGEYLEIALICRWEERERGSITNHWVVSPCGQG